jgi:uncharacterized protein (TIGR02722 family)
MKNRHVFTAMVCVLALPMLTGCVAFRRSVTERDPREGRPLTAKYDQRDLLSMPTEMCEKILSHPFPPQGVDRPLVAEMGIQNRTKSHLDTQALADRITSQMLDSRRVRLVNVIDRDKLLKEQGYQLSNCPTDKRVQIGKQLGARYMLTGRFYEVEHESGRQVRVSKKHDVYYQLTLVVTDLETGEEIAKKHVERMRRASKPLIGW